ncbi:MAG: hypothetical protein U9Q62_06425 [Campylobacterota bacterium]|nr:hypothetical protein [Campylobacterota bacterium]
MKRSTAALIIAILLHLLIILLFWILGMLAPEMKKAEPKEEEQRIKVSLKEQPKVVKDALVKNKQKQPDIAPPMPKGKQLKELVKEPLIVPPEPKPVQKPKPVTQQPVKRKEPAKPAPKKETTKPLPPKKKHVPLFDPKVTKPKKIVEANQTKPPKKQESAGLYAKLSKQTKVPEASTKQQRTKQRQSRISENVKEAYGDVFGTLSEGEQKYILDNQEIMRRITQEVLNRVGRVNIPNNLRVNTSNNIEFYLYPNGDISEIRFVSKSGFYVLDDTTKETIEYAYSRYPRPEQKTLIRYKVGYYLKGY